MLAVMMLAYHEIRMLERMRTAAESQLGTIVDTPGGRVPLTVERRAAHIDLAGRISRCCRAIDDVLLIDMTPGEQRWALKTMYPSSLELKRVCASPDRIEYLDLEIRHDRGGFYTTLYDKRDTLRLQGKMDVVRRFPHSQSMLSEQCRYSCFTSFMHRAKRCDMRVHDFVKHSAERIVEMYQDGYDLQKLLSAARRFMRTFHHPVERWASTFELIRCKAEEDARSVTSDTAPIPRNPHAAWAHTQVKGVGTTPAGNRKEGRTATPGRSANAAVRPEATTTGAPTETNAMRDEPVVDDVVDVTIDTTETADNADAHEVIIVLDATEVDEAHGAASEDDSSAAEPTETGEMTTQAHPTAAEVLSALEAIWETDCRREGITDPDTVWGIEVASVSRAMGMRGTQAEAWELVAMTEGALQTLDGRTYPAMMYGWPKPRELEDSLIYCSPPEGPHTLGDEVNTDCGNWIVRVAGARAFNGGYRRGSTSRADALHQPPQQIVSLSTRAMEHAMIAGTENLRAMVGASPQAPSFHTQSAIMHAARWHTPEDTQWRFSEMREALKRLLTRGELIDEETQQVPRMVRRMHPNSMWVRVREQENMHG